MLKSQVPVFDGVAVLVIGDVMLDRYWRGGTSRISPEAPVPVVRVGDVEDRPGGAANVALNLAALGANPILVGLTGDDEAADALELSLEAAGVECHFERFSSVSTITKLRILSSNQQLIRLDFEDPFPEEAAQKLIDRAVALVDRTQVVICSDYAKGALGKVPQLIAHARAAQRRVLVDPKGSDFSRYRGASVITPNLLEFEAVVGRCANECELVEHGRDIVEQLELEALLVTRGEQGMTLLREHASEFHLPAQAREVFDVTGAGDTVIATLAAVLAAEDSLQRATILANVAAGCVVGKLGTAVVTPAELQRSLAAGVEAGYGAVNEEQLEVAVVDSRAHGERIVMTNGCFDILHAGHVAYLSAARRLGDRLVVALNDDDSVRRLKGNGRPVNPLERRSTVLAALRSVDWVVPFSENTPERLIHKIQPDVLVKGGDYRSDEIAGHDSVVANGGEVRVLGYEESLSTTGIMKQIQTAQCEEGVS